MDNPDYWESITEWGQASGLRVVAILLTIWVLRKFGNLAVRRSIHRAVRAHEYATVGDQKKREDTLVSMVSASLRVMLWVVGGMLVVQEFGLDIGPLIAGASILGVALGFGAQSLVKDFVSGIFIIVENQYRVGDVVEIAGVAGSVEAITMRETILRNLRGEQIHVPNGEVGVAKNMTKGFSNIIMDIGISYDSDIEKVEKVVNDVGIKLAGDPEWSSPIVEPPTYQRVQKFGPSEVEIRIVASVLPGQQWNVAGELRKRIKKAFDKNKIEIPFPQRVIHEPKKK